MRRFIFAVMFCVVLATPVLAAPLARPGEAVALAYVLGDQVWLGASDGSSVFNTGLQLNPRQAATLFWSPDGNNLYISTRDGLYITGAEGSSAVRLPGIFGLTIAIARHGGAIYNLDVESPQDLAPAEDGVQRVAFPLRETNLANASEGRGRMVSYIGAFNASAGQLAVTHAAALYARDNGLLGNGRPHLWATFGASLFYNCCFPDPGLALVNVSNGEIFPNYDPEFLAGAAGVNDAASRIAAPTVNGAMRVYDLITEGWRDYVLDLGGDARAIEQVEWAIDDSAIYFALRTAPRSTLELLPSITTPVDTRSANVRLWKLDLVTGRLTHIVDFVDVYGVSSMAITHDYAFVVTVGRNEALVYGLNQGNHPADIALTDSALEQYMPKTTLWRIDLDTKDMIVLTENAWGVSARPN